MPIDSSSVSKNCMFVMREGIVEDGTVSNKAGDVLETNVSKANNILGHVQWVTSGFS